MAAYDRNNQGRKILKDYAKQESFSKQKAAKIGMKKTILFLLIAGGILGVGYVFVIKSGGDFIHYHKFYAPKVMHPHHTSAPSSHTNTLETKNSESEFDFYTLLPKEETMPDENSETIKSK